MTKSYGRLKDINIISSLFHGLWSARTASFDFVYPGIWISMMLFPPRKDYCLKNSLLGRSIDSDLIVSSVQGRDLGIDCHGILHVQDVIVSRFGCSYIYSR